MYIEVKNYLTLLERVGELIKRSKYKTEYIMSELGMKKATFYNKLQKSNFTPKEMLRLAEILEPEKVREEKIKGLIELGEAQIIEEKVKPHNLIMKSSRAKYNV